MRLVMGYGSWWWGSLLFVLGVVLRTVNSNVNSILEGNSATSPLAHPPNGQVLEKVDELVQRAHQILEDPHASSSKLTNAISLLDKALEEDHPLAALYAAQLFFFGRTNWEPDHERSVVYLDRCVDPECHLMLGVCHLFGLGGKTFSPHHALTYMTAAAEGGNAAARIALGHAYSQGQLVTKSCPRARSYYYPVATEMAHKWEKSHHSKVPKLTRLSWDQGKNQGQSTQDVIDFYNYNSDPRDADSMFFLGQVYYLGIGGVERDLQLAREYFERAADLGNIAAEGYLGQMDYYGEAIATSNYREAYHHFRKAARSKGAVGQNGMGLLYWKGIEVVKDINEAMKYFKLASEQGYAEASFNLAQVLYELDPIENEDRVFAAYLAALRGGFLRAGYELAKLNMGKDLTCGLARFLLQNFLDKHELFGMMDEAYDLFKSGKYGPAVSRYMYCAAMGLEMAQYNAAFTLEVMAKHEQNPTSLYRRALLLWSEAASQDNTYSLLRLGDYFYYGWGLDRPEPVTAAAFYHQAIDKKSPQAAYNLGYLHERGLGVPLDFYMAKKYYEKALTLSKSDNRPEAWLPIYLSLKRLILRTRWQTWRKRMLNLPRWSIPVMALIILSLGSSISLIAYIMSTNRRVVQVRIHHNPSPTFRNNANENGDNNSNNNNEGGEGRTNRRTNFNSKDDYMIPSGSDDTTSDDPSSTSPSANLLRRRIRTQSSSTSSSSDGDRRSVLE